MVSEQSLVLCHCETETKVEAISVQRDRFNQGNQYHHHLNLPPSARGGRIMKWTVLGFSMNPRLCSGQALVNAGVEQNSVFLPQSLCLSVSHSLCRSVVIPVSA